MRTLCEQLEPLDADARARVLVWACLAWGVIPPVTLLEAARFRVEAGA